MTRENLLHKLTGTETPKFLTERENKMIDIFLTLINQRREDRKVESIKIWDFAKIIVEKQKACFEFKSDPNKIYWSELEDEWFDALYDLIHPSEEFKDHQV